MAAPQDRQRIPGIAFLGLLLSVFIAPAGLIVSIIAWRRIRKGPFRGQWLAIVGTLIGAVLTIPFLFIVWLFIALGAWRGNQAARDFKPIAKEVVRLGGVKLCDNGDSGYGIDNVTPWYEAYYKIPDLPGLTEKITAVAAEQGYQLRGDTLYINQLKGLPDPDGSYTTPYGGEEFNPKSDYLTARDGDRSLKVTVNRQTSVPLYCGVKNYGEKRSTGSEAILDFNLTLPDTNRQNSD